MLKEPSWLTLADVVYLHDRLIKTYGGGLGVRDTGLLESALERPRNLLAYGNPDMFALVAAYAYGLCKNHAFVDGNKRTAFTAAGVFLEKNGYALKADEEEAVITMVKLAVDEISESEFAVWLKDNTRNA